MKRLLPLTLALLALSAPPALAGRDVLRERSRQDVDPAGVRSVRAENSHGDIRVTASPDDRIHVTALKIVRSGSRAESRRMARDIRVQISNEAGELAVRARYPSRRSVRIGFWDLFKDFEVPSAEVRIGLELPGGVALAVRTSSGDVETAGLPGRQRLETTSGDITVSDAAGELSVQTTSGDVTGDELGRSRLRTVSGDVEIRGAHGPLDVHSTNGDLTVHEAADSLVLGTVSGDVTVEGAARGLDLTTTNGTVRVRRARGRIEVGASSGNVDVAVVAPLTAIDITTGSGDIDLRMERGMGGRLELQTSNGTLEMDQPVQVLSLTRRRVTGQLRQGTAPIRLRSASGDIHVITGDQGS